MSQASGERLVELDGLRGLAAFGVAIFHLRVFLQGTPNPLAQIPGSDLVLVKGWFLVDLFFVISGFIFVHCYLRDGAMRAGVGVGDFAWARFSRLWPLHFAVLCFTALMLRHDPDTNAITFMMSLAFLHAFLPDIEVLNPPAWSISVECICYALFAGLAGLGQRRHFIAGAAILAIAGGALLWTETSIFIGRGLLGFFIGCLIYEYRQNLNRIPVPLLIACTCVFGVLGNSQADLMLASVICWPALVLLAPRISLLRTPACEWLGSRSYAIYIVQVPLFIMLGNFLPLVTDIPVVVPVVVCLAATLVVADILHRNLEVPAQRYLRQVPFPRHARAE
jgi:peptidoglycan/LPS O-acetylase OafA/YrhL